MDSRPPGSGRPTDRTVTALLTIAPVRITARTVMRHRRRRRGTRGSGAGDRGRPDGARSGPACRSATMRDAWPWARTPAGRARSVSARGHGRTMRWVPSRPGWSVRRRRCSGMTGTGFRCPDAPIGEARWTGSPATGDHEAPRLEVSACPTARRASSRLRRSRSSPRRISATSRSPRRATTTC